MMHLFDRMLRRKVTEVKFCQLFESSAHSILAAAEKAKPFYSILFVGEDVAGNALDAMRPAFAEIARLESRKVQSRKLLGIYFKVKTEEVCLDFFANECPDIMLGAYASKLIDGGDDYLLALALKTIRMDENLEQYSDTAKAYFKKKLFFEVYKNMVLICVLNILFGDVDDPEDLRRFELLVKEHVKKMGVEIMLQNPQKGDGVIPLLAQKYDFNETKRRTDLIARFIQGVELDSKDSVDQVCDEFASLLQNNYDVIQEVKNHV